jgi:hypothetical protein
MKVFLSWSGARSKEVALLFREWLPKVIQAVDPWMSDVDIEKGAHWFAEIFREVSAASFGVVFLTRENLEKPWLHFEAGALAKALSPEGNSPRVATYLLGIDNSDVVGPLKEFQHTKATAEDTLKLLLSVNSSLAANGEKPLKDEMLKSIFDTFWAALDGPLNAALTRKESEKPVREVRDMVEEILEYVRPRAPTLERASIAEITAQLNLKNARASHHASQARLLTAEAQVKSILAAKQRLSEQLNASTDDAQKELLASRIHAVETAEPALQNYLEQARADFVKEEAQLAAAVDKATVLQRTPE